MILQNRQEWKDRKRTLLVCGAVNLLILCVSLPAGVSVLFTLAVLVWLDLFLYAAFRPGRRGMLLAFLITFFLFLMGREVLEQYFGYRVNDEFTTEIVRHAHICLLLGLAALGAGYLFFEKPRPDLGDALNRLGDALEKRGLRRGREEELGKAALCIFCVTWVFSIVSELHVIWYVFRNGYTSYYLSYDADLAGNVVLYGFSKLKQVMPAAFCIFCATMPGRKAFRLPCLLYLFYLLLSLASGQRAPFMLGLFFLGIYHLYRQEIHPGQGWIRRKHLIVCAICVPVLVILFVLISGIRTGSGGGGVWTAPVNFLYEQGVSVNVLKRAYMFQSRIPDQMYTLEFLHSGLPARLLRIPVYHGNNLEHAMYGGSFTHSLGYVVLGSNYLKGMGLGSSYLAELYQDFGYPGILFGSVLYAYLISRITAVPKRRNTLLTGLRFYSAAQLLWAPRASFTYFITMAIAPSTILCFVGVYLLAMLFARVPRSWQRIESGAETVKRVVRGRADALKRLLRRKQD